MGFFSNLFTPPPLDLEELRNDRCWGSAFMTVNDIYTAFSEPGLDHNAPLLIVPDNPYNEDLPRVFDSFSYEIVDYGNTMPMIIFDPRGGGTCYGGFVDDLYRKGEENGWDYLYKLEFGYYLPRTKTMWRSTPFFPSISFDGCSARFVVTAEEWSDAGNLAKAGIGGAAGL